jgi:hypothetical protein
MVECSARLKDFNFIQAFFQGEPPLINIDLHETIGFRGSWKYLDCNGTRRPFCILGRFRAWRIEREGSIQRKRERESHRSPTQECPL